MKAISELVNEHKGITLMLDIMSSAADKISGNENIEIHHLEEMLEFLSGFADKCHHGKEEEILFARLQISSHPSMAEKLTDILQEHQQGRDLISASKSALSAYKAGDKAKLQELALHFRQYAKLLYDHIEKENFTLFPALAKLINDNLDKELFEAYERLEKEVIGLGRHEEYHAMLNKFKKIYL